METVRGEQTTPTFNSERRPPARITIIGVGGGGSNAVIRLMQERTVAGVNYVCVNTDVKSLEQAQAAGATLIQIGDNMTHGLGAGGDPEVGAKAAESSKQQLTQAMRHSDLVFVTAGMGGGTGTGAAPIVADLAKKSGALVVGLVTTPFSWEGRRRLDQAIAGIGRLKPVVDNLLVVHNDRLLKMIGGKVPMEEALRRADETVMFGILAVAELINVPGEINVDMADVRAILKIQGRALMAIGEAEGPDGALKAAQMAVANPLLDVSVDKAKGVLFCVNGGPGLTLGDVNAAGEFIAEKVHRDAVVFFGMVNNPRMVDRVRLTLIATGIPTNDQQAVGGTIRTGGRVILDR